MNRFFIFIGLLISPSVFANGADWVDRQNEKVKQSAQKEQRMEESKPSSTALGGSRSGALEKEKAKDIETRREDEKQRQLFENEGLYRRGL